MQHFGKAALRVTKNYTKGYSDTQAKVRDATSNDPWGPSGTQMNEIAQLTYNQNDFVEIMEMLDKRLNDKGKNWRHVFKSLTVLDYCLHQGSENVVIYFRDNAYIIKTLKEFQYVDEDGKDQGANVRQKAKDITNLLMDESRLREERRARASMRDRMIRGAKGHGDEDEGDENQRRRQQAPNGSLAGKRPNRDEEELKKAIEESKRSLAAEQLSAEERDLQRAIKLSEEEEAKRKNLVEDTNASALFDDQNQLPPPTTTNPFPFTDPTPYATGLQPQFTQLQPQFTQVQPQFTSFNPYQQQAEQEAAQAEYLRQQQLFLQQQQQAQQQQAQQEEWMRQQQLLQMQQQQQQQQLQQQNSLFVPQQLTVQPTGFGSNNPFAPSTSSSPSFSPVQKQAPAFNLGGTYDNHSDAHLSSLSSSSPVPPASSNPYQNQNQQQDQGQKTFQVKTKKELGETEQHLAQLFANRDDGTDTFGNFGALRYGYTEAGRLAQQKTSTNPFAQQQQQQQQQQSNERPFFDI
ncbi:putative epsin N-terminal homology (ENTH) domain containing protein [Lyophyllum shimeji]|uniref:Epsin N-terminal homology (ENTH) domain containing protein n=1 Tax=Lyophyllum shimeji TaxID=47721 RepID=A0A9P3US22_LYOSH|nr:putative epsin N-terminal homology (ENTH) domain containing protein [Lyophyllum shimeji]